MNQKQLAQVLLPFGDASRDSLFTYEIPPELQGEIRKGDAVRVPFRSSVLSGFVVNFVEQFEKPTKPILGKHGKLASLSPFILDFSRWIADRYLSSWWEALRGFTLSREKNGGKSENYIHPASVQLEFPEKFLTPEQEAASSRIQSAVSRGTFESFLLHGITGSGKTEIYLSCALEALKSGKQVLVLVPEIPLSFQTSRKFQEVFGNQVVVLHSSLPEKEKRKRQWELYEKKAKIAVGPRMSLFAPFQNLGLIILDEEHDQSYKQESQPRYHAFTVAEKLAQEVNAVLLVGSATPSLERYYSCRKKEMTLLTLESRYESRPLPAVKVVDMRTAKANRPLPFSRELIEALEDTLAKNHQAILFLNRRGFSPLVLCMDCGFTFQCPRCSITFTYHLARGIFRCHYCDAQQSVPKACPKCAGGALTFRGFGTQRLEEELKKYFPRVSVLRLDRDTAAKKDGAKTILETFGKREAQILIGTQMVTKGFHFPYVSLVGIIYADQLLHFPDFRASEKTFQLLTQVAGRAGRGMAEGQAVLQTYNPEHPAILAAANHDYSIFYQQEIEHRKKAGYPPFVSLANLVLSSQEEAALQQQVNLLHDFLNRLVQETEGVQLLGPSPCPLEKVNRNYRWHFLLKSQNVENLTQLGQKIYSWNRENGSRKVRCILDIDPLQLL